jgi:hypothetical protein
MHARAVLGTIEQPTMAPTRASMDYARVPPAHWQAALDAHHPPSIAWGRLRLHWISGDQWQPVHRWVVFQCQHHKMVSPDVWRTYHADLAGPHPRWRTRVQQVVAVMNGQRQLRTRVVPDGRERAVFDRYQWECAQAMYAESGEWWIPRWFWVIQGAHGGHPFDVDAYSGRLLKVLTGADTVPSIGDLPYAEFDRRVTERMAAWDLWRHVRGGEAPSQAVARLIAQRAETEREANAVAWDAWTDSAEQWGDELQYALRADGFHRVRMNGPRQMAAPLDEQRAQYLTPTESVP